jgi:integrase
MKMRKSHIVPLPNQAIEILHRLKADYGQWESVFPSQTASRKHISKNTICALYRMGYKGNATGYGFGVLAMTAILENLGYSFDIVDAHSRIQKEVR